MMNIHATYSIESEVERIQNTLERLDFYNKKGYSLFFPINLHVGGGDTLKENHIKESVINEYDEAVYRKEKKYIEDNISTIHKMLQTYSTQTSMQLQGVYEVQLTRYGVGGSYALPNKILVNIQSRTGAKLLKTLIHEIIHLSIEEWIRAYKVEHWEKERIVDLIVEKIAPDINVMQNLPIETSEIDKAFNTNYPDIEKIINNLK